MSYDLAVNNLLELKFYCHQRGQYTINTRHYRVTGIVGTGETDVNAGIKLNTELAGAFIACVGADAQFLGVSIQLVKPIRRPKTVLTTSAGDGGLEGEPLPRQVAGLIKVTTDEASRHGRGRMYVPFPTEAVNTATGVPSGAYVDALNNLALKLDDIITVGGGGNTATLQPVLWNRATDARIQVTGAAAAAVWATQRRRADIRGGDRPPF